MSAEDKLTAQVAKDLGRTPSNLMALIRDRKIAQPRKDPSGRYWWTPADVAKAKAALAIDRRRREFAEVRHAQ